MTLTFYVLMDLEVPTCVKVGKDTQWPRRYKQARCHSPGKIVVAATLQMPSAVRAEQSALDSEVKRVLSPYAREVSMGRSRVQEWYDLTAEQAVNLLLTIPALATSLVTIEPPEIKFEQSAYEYEDWRDRDHPQARWRVFLFQVIPAGHDRHPHGGRLKLAAGSLYDTAYRYNFTYCPFPVALIGGFETSLEVRDNNHSVVRAWESVVEASGDGPHKQPLGWLRSNATPQLVRDLMEVEGCLPFPLSRPKPVDARPRDSSVSQTPIGGEFPPDRIKDAYF